MNSHKKDANSSTIEASLGRVLRNWTARQFPPSDGRARLMQAVNKLQQRRLAALLPIGGLWDARGNHPAHLSSLFYAPQMSFLTAWINF